MISAFLGIDFERDFPRKLPDELSFNMERSVYNHRKRGLLNNWKTLCKELAHSINSQDCHKYIRYAIRSMQIKSQFSQSDLQRELWYSTRQKTLYGLLSREFTLI